MAEGLILFICFGFGFNLLNHRTFGEIDHNIVNKCGQKQDGIHDHHNVDHNFGQILAACPDAYIFPRVNVNLSEAWEKAHPEELCEAGFGNRCRVSYASDLWAEEVKRGLSALIEYIESSSPET